MRTCWYVLEPMCRVYEISTSLTHMLNCGNVPGLPPFTETLWCVNTGLRSTTTHRVLYPNCKHMYVGCTVHIDRFHLYQAEAMDSHVART